MIKEKLAKLIDVKSIVTIILVIIFSILALKEIISGSEFMTVFTMVISFYFWKQTEKKGSGGTNE